MEEKFRGDVAYDEEDNDEISISSRSSRRPEQLLESERNTSESNYASFDEVSLHAGPVGN